MSKTVVFLIVSVIVVIPFMGCSADNMEPNRETESNGDALEAQDSKTAEKQAVELSHAFFHVEGLMKTASGAT